MYIHMYVCSYVLRGLKTSYLMYVGAFLHMYIIHTKYTHMLCTYLINYICTSSR